LNEKSHGIYKIWGKMQIHGALIFTYALNQGRIGFWGWPLCIPALDCDVAAA